MPVKRGRSVDELLDRLRLFDKLKEDCHTMTVIELRNKRAKALVAAQGFLDSHRGEDGFLSDEDDAIYTGMENDITNLGKEISRMERLEQMDSELFRPMNSPITEKPARTREVDDKVGTASDSYKKAFWNQIRSKTIMTPELRNALETGEVTEGGYLVRIPLSILLCRG